MIVTCPRCGSTYNNQTINQCPACLIFKPRKKKKQDSRFAGIESFIGDQLREQRRQASGYRHKVKTGGGSAV